MYGIRDMSLRTCWFVLLELFASFFVLWYNLVNGLALTV
jgi:hypothetical protein